MHDFTDTSPRLALLLCAFDRPEYLEPNLLHHCHLGVERAYVYLDRRPGDSALLSMPWVEILLVESGEAGQFPSPDDLHAACMNHALQLARDEGYDWMLSTKPEEAAYVAVTLGARDGYTQGEEGAILRLLAEMPAQVEVAKLSFSPPPTARLPRNPAAQDHLCHEIRGSEDLTGSPSCGNGAIRTIIRTSTDAQALDLSKWVVDQQALYPDRPSAHFPVCEIQAGKYTKPVWERGRPELGHSHDSDRAGRPESHDEAKPPESGHPSEHPNLVFPWKPLCQKPVVEIYAYDMLTTDIDRLWGFGALERSEAGYFRKTRESWSFRLQLRPRNYRMTLQLLDVGAPLRSGVHATLNDTPVARVSQSRDEPGTLSWEIPRDAFDQSGQYYARFHACSAAGVSAGRHPGFGVLALRFEPIDRASASDRGAERSLPEILVYGAKTLEPYQYRGFYDPEPWQDRYFRWTRPRGWLRLRLKPDDYDLCLSMRELIGMWKGRLNAYINGRSIETCGVDTPGGDVKLRVCRRDFDRSPQHWLRLEFDEIDSWRWAVPDRRSLGAPIFEIRFDRINTAHRGPQ